MWILLGGVLTASRLEGLGWTLRKSVVCRKARLLSKHRLLEGPHDDELLAHTAIHEELIFAWQPLLSTDIDALLRNNLDWQSFRAARPKHGRAVFTDECVCRRKSGWHESFDDNVLSKSLSGQWACTFGEHYSITINFPVRVSLGMLTL